MSITSIEKLLTLTLTKKNENNENNENKQEKKKIKWKSNVIDNEHLCKKKSNCCCYYKPFDPSKFNKHNK